MSPYSITREDAAKDAAAIRTGCLKWAYLSDGAEFIDTLRSLADSIEEQVKPAIEEPKQWGSLVRASFPNSDGDRILLAFVPNPQESDPDKPQGYPWYSERDDWCAWDDLSDVEVLRIGVGEALRADEATIEKVAKVIAYFRANAEAAHGDGDGDLTPTNWDRTGADQILALLNAYAAGDVTPPDSDEAAALARALLSVGDTTAYEAPADADEFMTSAGFTGTPGQKVAYKWGARDTAAKVIRWLRQLRAEALTAERQNAYDKAIKLVEELAR